MSTATTGKHLMISTLVSLSLPVLMFIIACLVRDIANVTEALWALMFLAILTVPLFVSYWILGEIQLRREDASVKISLWYSGLFSVVVTLIFVIYAIYVNINLVQIVLGASIIFLLLWLVHLTGSITQFVRMTDYE